MAELVIRKLLREAKLTDQLGNIFDLALEGMSFEDLVQLTKKINKRVQLLNRKWTTGLSGYISWPMIIY